MTKDRSLLRRRQAAASPPYRHSTKKISDGSGANPHNDGECSSASVLAGLIDDERRGRGDSNRNDDDDGSVASPPMDAASHRAMLEAMLSEAASSDDGGGSDDGDDCSGSESSAAAVYRAWGADSEEEGELEYNYCLSTREGVTGLLTFLSEMAADAEDGGAKTVGGKRFVRRRRRRRLAAALVAFGALCFLLGFLTCAAVVALWGGTRGESSDCVGGATVANSTFKVNGEIGSFHEIVENASSTNFSEESAKVYGNAKTDPTYVIDIDEESPPGGTVLNESQADVSEKEVINNASSAGKVDPTDDSDDDFTQVNVTSEALYATDKTMQISRTNRLLFVDVPNSGGTAVADSSLFDDARAHHPVGGNYPVKSMVRGSAGRGLSDGFVRAALVRHPCARFVSAFEYMKAHGNEGDRAWARVHIGNRTVREFLAILEEGERGAEMAVGEVETHFLPMEHFLFMPNGKLGVDTLLCAERWNESMDRLGMAIGRPVPQDLYTTKEEMFPPDPTHEMGDSGPEGCSLLDSETRESIERLYAVDYCVFGYSTGPNTAAPEGCGDEPPEIYAQRYAECHASSS